MGPADELSGSDASVKGPWTEGMARALAHRRGPRAARPSRARRSGAGEYRRGSAATAAPLRAAQLPRHGQRDGAAYDVPQRCRARCACARAGASQEDKKVMELVSKRVRRSGR